MKKILLLFSIFVLTLMACNRTKKSKVKEFDKLKTDIDNTPHITISKKQEPEITKTDYINFLNGVLDPELLIIDKGIKIMSLDSLHWHSELNRLTKISTNDSLMHKIIDYNDIRFIYHQSETLRGTTLESGEIDRKKIKPIDLAKITFDNPNPENFWEEIHKIGSGVYTNIELPLFSIDKTIVIFKYSYRYDQINGNSGIFIYKKENGKWKMLDEIGSETLR